MAKNKNQSRDRGTSPARGSESGGEQSGSTMEAQPPAAQNSGMNQEISRKRKKKFGHN